MQKLFAEPYSSANAAETIDALIENLDRQAFGHSGDVARREIACALLARLPEFDRRRLVVLNKVTGCSQSQAIYAREIIEFHRHYKEFGEYSYRQALSNLGFSLGASGRHAEALPFLLEVVVYYAREKDLHMTGWILERIQLLPFELRTDVCVLTVVNEVTVLVSGGGTTYHRIIFERCAELLAESGRHGQALAVIERILNPQSDEKSRFQNPNYLYALGFKTYCQVHIADLMGLAENLKPIVAALRETARHYNSESRRGGGSGGN